MGQLSTVDLPSVLKAIADAVRYFGGALLIWGLVGLGLAIKDGQGMNSDNAWGKIIGGALVIAASFAFTAITNAS